MSDPQKIREYLKKKRKGLREEFLSVGGEFDYDISEFGFKLRGTQFSIYDENIDAVLLRSSQHGNVVANNTYLASFAYNVALVWLNYGHEYIKLADNADCVLARLLRYNFKKFFAEQILCRTNNVFGIAIFLETLLYQEREMRPIFAAAKADGVLSRKFEYFAQLMSGIFLFHEIGHLVHDARKDVFEGLLTDEIGEGGSIPFEPVWKNYNEAAKIEFWCDAFAVVVKSKDKPDFADQGFVLRSIAFGFIVCACMMGLEKSAAETARQHPASRDLDVLDEIHADLPGASFVIGRDEFLLARAQSAISICQSLARAAGIELFQPDGAFPLPKNTIDVLSNFTLSVVDWDDSAARGLCELLARALHDNDRGLEYLKLRSKVFKMPPGAEDAPKAVETIVS